MSQTVATHIEIREGRAGRPRAYISDTRIRVQDIYALAEMQGKTPEEIVDALPSLTLGQVYAALSYYFDHRDEIIREMHDDELLAEQIRIASGPGPLEQKLSQAGRSSEISSR